MFPLKWGVLAWITLWTTGRRVSLTLDFLSLSTPEEPGAPGGGLQSPRVGDFSRHGFEISLSDARAFFPRASWWEMTFEPGIWKTQEPLASAPEPHKAYTGCHLHGNPEKKEKNKKQDTGRHQVDTALAPSLLGSFVDHPVNIRKNIRSSIWEKKKKKCRGRRKFLFPLHHFLFKASPNNIYSLQNPPNPPPPPEECNAEFQHTKEFVLGYKPSIRGKSISNLFFIFSRIIIIEERFQKEKREAKTEERGSPDDFFFFFWGKP